MNLGAVCFGCHESRHERIVGRILGREYQRRLVRLQRAYQHMNRGDLAIEHEDFATASAEYAAAAGLAPEITEISFWHAVTLVTNGRVDDALPLFARAFRTHPSWMLLVPRLQRAGHLPPEADLRRRILAVGPRADLEATEPE